MSRRSERLRVKQMGAGTLRGPIRDATEEEVAEPVSANDDSVTPNSTERISLDGSITNQSRVNLMGKTGKAFQIGTWNVRTLNHDGKLELLLDEIDYTYMLLALVRPSGKEHDLFNQAEIPRSYSLAVQVVGKKMELRLFRKEQLERHI